MPAPRCLLPLFALALVSPPRAVADAPDLTVAPGASHVVKITADALHVATGTTYRFTVDTPEDQGLVSTAPTAIELLAQLARSDGAPFRGRVVSPDGVEKSEARVATGDLLVPDLSSAKPRRIDLVRCALSGRLEVSPATLTVDTPTDLTIRFTAGQRSPRATVRILLPAGLGATLDNTTVNVIGRGAVLLRDLPKQSIGRTGSAYPYTRVGEARVSATSEGGAELVLAGLDLRPANGADVELLVRGVTLGRVGVHELRATYTIAEPEVLASAGTGGEVAPLAVTATVADFSRVPDRRRPYRETPETYTSAAFRWSPNPAIRSVRLLQSLDGGGTWTESTGAMIDAAAGTARVTGLAPDRWHAFRLEVGSGPHAGPSNPAHFHSGKVDVRSFGAAGTGAGDDTDVINTAIATLAAKGGGTLRFFAGTYRVRTVRLRSNVWLYLERDATILALKGGDAPEPTWFSDRKYRSGLSPTDRGPYENPENWLTKQDVGHTFFRNTMFFGERLDNVKIIGTGRISGDGNLVTGDRVMNNPPDNRADKMFTLKLCTDLEIGGLHRDEDLWYDPVKDEPYYLARNDARSFDTSNMLHIDRGGHFVLLATGTDGILVHNTWFARHHSGNARDLYDFMQCNDVTVTNIYSKVSSDDIVKLGSDCSLGFTRPVRGYRVRNVIGDTNCNLFQIGSETADDIQDVHVDNIYVTGANKAGFSISTNDGAHVKDIHLNCGHTGSLHSRSKMLRTHTPFFISISNRARVLGATVERFRFDENGTAHDELLATNIDIGVVENVILNAIDVTEQYAGSSYGNNTPRWPAYNGKQRKAAPIVAGYKLPDAAVVEGGLNFRLPNGQHTGYVRNVVFNDVHFLAKGGNPPADSARQPPELGVGQYNASNLGVLPAYGLYARHVAGLTLRDCTFNYEQRDSTPALFLDDVTTARIAGVQVVRAADQPVVAQLKGSRDIEIIRLTVHADEWGRSPQVIKGPAVYAGDRGIALP